ncbi:MAG TPA: 5-oxoprolinase subunit PxpA [Spirochaetia bacterium]|nr:5-oxoprolinase subunit PxpA [Spirochaetia bacterium]
MADLTVDLNCDMGESFGVYKLGCDEEIVKFVSSANIACGWHAGDPRVMDHTVALAAARGVGVGAHPGLPDLAGFGRRNMDLAPQEIQTGVLYQIGALQAFCRKHGVRLGHVKAHGSLYNLASVHRETALAIVEAVRSFDPALVLVAPAGSEMYLAARQCGLTVAGEVFADRAYNPDGSLVPRRQEGAVIHDPETVAQRVVDMIREKCVRAIDGRRIPMKVDTVCVHGDNPNAVALAETVRNHLARAGIAVVPLERMQHHDG